VSDAYRTPVLQPTLVCTERSICMGLPSGCPHRVVWEHWRRVDGTYETIEVQRVDHSAKCPHRES
jgi:hypothetical protein